MIAEKASIFFRSPSALVSLLYQSVRTYQQLSKFISPYSTKRQSLSDFFSNVSTISVLV